MGGGVSASERVGVGGGAGAGVVVREQATIWIRYITLTTQRPVVLHIDFSHIAAGQWTRCNEAVRSCALSN